MQSACRAGEESHTIEHVCREQRENGTDSASHDGVSSHSRSCEHQVAVDNVIQALHEDHVDTEAQAEAG